MKRNLGTTYISSFNINAICRENLTLDAIMDNMPDAIRSCVRCCEFLTRPLGKNPYARRLSKRRETCPHGWVEIPNFDIWRSIIVLSCRAIICLVLFIYLRLLREFDQKKYPLVRFGSLCDHHALESIPGFGRDAYRPKVATTERFPPNLI